MTVSHSAFDDALRKAQIAVDPSQADGTLIGMLCMQPEMSLATWIGVLLEDSAADSVGQAALEEVAAQAGRRRAHIESEDLEFAPLLPADTLGLVARLRALGEWCSGYLYGLAVGGLKEFKLLSEAGQEFLQDATDLTRLVSRPEPEAIDENRYMELVEYVKVGVLTVLSETGGPHAASPGKDGGPALH